MKTDEIILKILKNHKLESLNTSALLANLADIHNKHSVLITSVNNAIGETFADKNAFIDCPDCGSKTMLGFGACHICGTSLYESEAEPVTKVEEKVEKQEDKVEVKEEQLDELDELDEDIVEEKPKKKLAKKKEKEIEEDIEGFEDDVEELMTDDVSLDDDDDFDFDLD